MALIPYIKVDYIVALSLYLIAPLDFFLGFKRWWISFFFFFLRGVPLERVVHSVKSFFEETEVAKYSLKGSLFSRKKRAFSISTYYIAIMVMTINNGILILSPSYNHFRFEIREGIERERSSFHGLMTHQSFPTGFPHSLVANIRQFHFITQIRPSSSILLKTITPSKTNKITFIYIPEEEKTNWTLLNSFLWFFELYDNHFDGYLKKYI